jgi:hypothetical protein
MWEQVWLTSVRQARAAEFVSPYASTLSFPSPGLSEELESQHQFLRHPPGASDAKPKYQCALSGTPLDPSLTPAEIDLLHLSFRSSAESTNMNPWETVFRRI